ncbi:hypothetical protein T12_16973 [Trichinella patagoniensis]|uniref:Uncharacterized protein n=1 Tax=Trichinella patagoniensis TaxID=990121 RepID=A0A0V0ZTE6_9BILA|nr:hypothetical protein T12_16973 [Trichinella patagoniensis]
MRKRQDFRNNKNIKKLYYVMLVDTGYALTNLYTDILTCRIASTTTANCFYFCNANSINHFTGEVEKNREVGGLKVQSI